ncbi:MAG: type I DNA topoisomerase [Elusimicrobiota bacterium]
MNKPVIIVESPTKAKVINRFLGGEYEVVSSMGHVRDLPKNKLGVDIDNDFDSQYEIIKGKGKIVKKISSLIKKSGEIYLGMDEDREGEAIGWHILQAAGQKGKEKEARRIVFHEVTPGAIKKALKSPRLLNMDLVDAQQARRILDRIVGYKLSPLLSKKIRRGLSAGRVQSVALKLIVSREKERKAFKPRDYYTVEGELNKKENLLPASLWGKKGKKLKKFDLDKKEKAKEVVDDCREKESLVKNVKKSKRKRRALPPFITSTLQQEAYKKLNMTPYSTMREAQKLYEGVELPDGSSAGLITYMRTDSVKIAKDAVKEARDLILKEKGKKYLPEKANYFRSKKSAQEAHECIRPVNVNMKPSAVKDVLSPKQYRLYDLIWRRFVASQMSPALIERVRVDLKCGDYDFRASGQVVVFEGYDSVWKGGFKEEKIPPVEKGDTLKWKKLGYSSHQTQPPARYTMASLVKELEKNGIGRPSTYAPILNTLFSRKYIHSEKGSLVPEEIAIIVTDNLQKHFSNVMDLKFTARMEENLDLVAQGKADWKKMLRQFYGDFSGQLAKASDEMEKIKDTQTDKQCPECGEPMVIRRGRNGKFMACTAFPKCKKTFNIDEKGNITREEKLKIKCPKCSAPLVVKKGRYGKFLACSAYPKCKTTLAIDEKGEIINIPLGFEKCPECGKNTTIKRGRKGFFLACTGYPKCRFAMSYDKALKKSRK